MSTWAQVLLGACVFVTSIIAHALIVTWIAGWKLGYNFRRMQDVTELTNRNSIDIIRMDKSLAALTGVSNGVHYRKEKI